MNRTVRKFRPSDYWRIGEHESWFQDMAAQGLHLKKMGKFFAHFVKGEPKKMRYRIDVTMKNKISPEQMEMYAESGWDYVTGYQYFQVYSSPEELDAPEIHTDPAEQSFTLKELDKKLVLNAGFVVVAMLLIIGMLFSIWFLDGTPTYILVEGLVIPQTFLTIILGYQAYNSLLAANSIRSIRKSLIEGKTIDHHAPWKKQHQLNSVIGFLFTIVAGLTVIFSFTQLIKMDTKTLPEGSLALPIVRLADVEQNPALVRGNSEYMSDNVDWSNRYSSNWSPFAPVQYESDENGLVPGERWEDGSGEYSPSIETRFYQLSFPDMAEPLISDLIKRHNYENRIEDFIETKNPSFDYLMVRKEEDFKEVYASKGKNVIFVRYYGYADMDSVVKAIEKKITE
ncbi:DUF2812 domain-containing protein [Fredinandcohnia sp. QZ13]|uniref:DUF2812 domain-containing protein n=1 Tax=Fredinandcohnia sp. QZ13 TaxID=3073144 RepID=UPI0028533B11|nr:DUF2812 domain-containing protein [Fredinandcohnia sp. QZ13]MDR4889873.1 DUF2812 domain-containing protein [Fredinandcohnia sp. QZ13]